MRLINAMAIQDGRAGRRAGLLGVGHGRTLSAHHDAVDGGEGFEKRHSDALFKVWRLMEDTAPKPFVFVLMPFSNEFTDIYEVGIKAACKEAGAYCERVD